MACCKDMRESDEILFYEEIWAESSTVVGVERVKNTTRYQKAAWTIALLGKSDTNY